jgi:hypothetical protein
VFVLYAIVCTTTIRSQCCNCDKVIPMQLFTLRLTLPRLSEPKPSTRPRIQAIGYIGHTEICESGNSRKLLSAVRLWPNPSSLHLTSLERKLCRVLQLRDTAERTILSLQVATDAPITTHKHKQLSRTKSEKQSDNHKKTTSIHMIESLCLLSTIPLKEAVSTEQGVDP